MTQEEKIRRINSIQWFHSIEIEPGLITPGRVPLAYLRDMLRYLQFPESFEGLTVLDIGAYDGFFSFEAERRGARRVVALDLYPRPSGFALAKELLGSRVEYVQGSVYDLSPDRLGIFDVVFFFGVFYHLRYPLLALDRIWGVTGQYMLMETHCLDRHFLWADRRAVPLVDIDPRLTEVALWQFYRHDELMPGDFSNWFAPNQKAIEDALASAGFRPELLAAWDHRVAYKAVKVPGVPEYQRQTYEGLCYIDRGDGKFLMMFPLRTGEVLSSGYPDPPTQQLLLDVDRLRLENERLWAAVCAVRRSRTYRILRKIGRWAWFERLTADLADRYPSGQD